MDCKPAPHKLYKYKAFDTFSIRLLTQSELYYANPRHFNDPLDCAPTIINDVDLTSLEELFYHFFTEAGLDKMEEAKSKIGDFCYQSTKYGDYKTDAAAEKYIKYSINNEIKRILDAEMGKNGVLSLAEKWNNPLMWSHYADEHRGLCIEYDTERLPHETLNAVNYRSPRSIKVSDLIKWKVNESSEAARRVHDTYFFAKSPEWRYEKEWRDISEGNGIKASTYPITAVYFGMRCDPAVVATIVMLFSRNPEITLYEVHPLDDRFRLKRRLVDRDETEACGVRPFREPASLSFRNLFLPK
jgi:hypothetical protein